MMNSFLISVAAIGLGAGSGIVAATYTGSMVFGAIISMIVSFLVSKRLRHEPQA